MNIKMSSVNPLKSSWADEVELDNGVLPQPSEVHANGHKYVTEYKFNDDNKKVKVVRTYKVTKQLVPKTVAQRRNWAKFGDSKNDQPGPNSQTTRVSEDITMQFLNLREEEKAREQLLLESTKTIAKCRICNGEHWSVNCPYKGTTMDTDKIDKLAMAGANAGDSSKPGKYVPPFLKDSQKAGANARGRDDTAAVRISNLSESTTEADLEELICKIGPYSKIYVAHDKNTGACKGFAYVHFKQRKDAIAAIQLLNGHGYDHLILNVEWSKPQNN